MNEKFGSHSKTEQDSPDYLFNLIVKESVRRFRSIMLTRREYESVLRELFRLQFNVLLEIARKRLPDHLGENQLQEQFSISLRDILKDAPYYIDKLDEETESEIFSALVNALIARQGEILDETKGNFEQGGTRRKTFVRPGKRDPELRRSKKKRR